MFKSLKKKIIIFILLIIGIYTMMYTSGSVLEDSFSKIKSTIADVKSFNFGGFGMFFSTLVVPALSGVLYALSVFVKRKNSFATFLADTVVWVLCNGAGMAGCEILTKFGVALPDLESLCSFPEFASLVQSIGLNADNIGTMIPTIITAAPILTGLLTKMAAGLLKK